MKQTVIPIADYTATSRVGITGTPQGIGNQPGDPVRSAVTRRLQRQSLDIDALRATRMARNSPKT